jgi:hypothetical protein
VGENFGGYYGVCLFHTREVAMALTSLSANRLNITREGTHQFMFKTEIE